MDDIGKLLTIALGVLAIATAAGFGLQRGRISAQDKRIETLQGQLGDSDDELGRKDRRLTETVAELAKVKTDLAALARVVTGEAHWVAIGEKLDNHHDEASTHWAKDEAILGDVETILTEIRDRLPAKGAL